MKFSITIISVLIIIANAISGEEHPSKMKESLWSVRVADSFLSRHPGSVTYDSGSPSKKWNYEQGLMLVALNQLYLISGDKKYFDFVQNNLDLYIDENGTIKTYDIEDYNLDNIGPGRAILEVYKNTNELKYKYAADTLKKQLLNQPRTIEGGFWHKKIYPSQMWLDGLFMAEPFYAKYAVMFNEPDAFNDISNQFIFIAAHTRDPKTGLFYHGWDESKQQKWATPVTGCSPNFWSRSMGWYLMGLIDVLDYIPKDHPKRKELLAIFKNLSNALLKFRDTKTNLWYQVTDQENRTGNYLETSASCMFAYCFAKGANKGFLKKNFLGIAKQIFDGVIKNKIDFDSAGIVSLHGTCKSAGLGGKPYRDGSFEYYISEPQRTNDMKGIGPFLLAAIELEKSKKGTNNIKTDMKGKNRK
jgi:unsaturated rhamnogalacturonyl hydrolase